MFSMAPAQGAENDSFPQGNVKAYFNTLPGLTMPSLYVSKNGLDHSHLGRSHAIHSRFEIRRLCVGKLILARGNLRHSSDGRPVAERRRDVCGGQGREVHIGTVGEAEAKRAVAQSRGIGQHDRRKRLHANDRGRALDTIHKNCGERPARRKVTQWF